MNCCDGNLKDLEKTTREQKRILWAVLIINLGMFFVEIAYGFLSKSQALVGDSLDMLGDAATYGSSILVVGMAFAVKARVAKLKAWIMLIFGLSISAQCIYRSL